MLVEVTKKDLINMINGIHPKSMQECDDYTISGLMKFTGNQWNENWDWVTSELEKMSEEQLFNLYIKHK
jgi:hypothetical protein